MDGAFYRGSATEQTSKFSDKEKKLLREMKFEKQLETEVNLKKIDINVIKPWITQKLTALLGMEDDVVNEYVFSQLEEKQLNPKIMQINLTGFLNARRAREFMGELWQLLIEAQNSADGIPMSLVEKKIEELKATDQRPDDAVAIDLKDTSSNWNNRYQSLTYGKYKPQVKDGEDDEEPARHRSTSPKPKSSNDLSRNKDRRRRDRSESPERRRRRRSVSPDRHRRKRDRSESVERHRRKRSRSPEKRKKKRERSVERRERKRSRSAERHKRKRSKRSPERREKKRSRSPRRRERKRSPSAERRERSKSDDS